MKKSELKILIKEVIKESGLVYDNEANDGDQMEDDMREEFVNVIASWQDKGADRKMIQFAFEAAFRYLENMR